MFNLQLNDSEAGIILTNLSQHHKSAQTRVEGSVRIKKNFKVIICFYWSIIKITGLFFCFFFITVVV